MYTVHNMHWYKNKPRPDFSWYVGRPRIGEDWPILANPFVSERRTRFEVIQPGDPRFFARFSRELRLKNNVVFLSDDPIADYRRWLWHQLQIHGVVRMIMQDMAIHGDGVLLCFCAPAPCHADVIVRAIEWQRLQMK